MDGRRSGNIPGFMVQEAAAFAKAPTGGETGEGERGATSIPAPAARAGAGRGRTSAHAGGAVPTSGGIRARSHWASSGHAGSTNSTS
jgi:hypothetical protein